MQQNRAQSGADARNLHLSHSYSLSGGHGQFSINPATGQIITSSLLDREDRASYQLLVVAADGGQPQGLSSSATVSVTVADINDNPPRFHHHPYVTHIPASTAAGLHLKFCHCRERGRTVSSDCVYESVDSRLEKVQNSVPTAQI